MQICNTKELQTFMQNIGATAASHFIIYDNKGGSDAMRLAWIFDCYNIDNYQIINGGKTAWKQTKLPIDTVSSFPIPNKQYITNATLDTSLYAYIHDVKNAIDDTNTIIINTREQYEYEGKPFIDGQQVLSHKKGAFIRGCIPRATHLNWSSFADPSTDHRIKCSKDLLYNLELKNITKAKKIIVYCQSGSRSSHTVFVLKEILGLPNVKNYDDSWIEWSYNHY